LVQILLTNRRKKGEVTSPNSTQNFFSEWGTMKHGVPQGSILGCLLLIIYINYSPPESNSLSKPIFPDDTSVIISSRNVKDFWSVSNLVLSYMIKCFAASNLDLNLDKMNTMKFITFHTIYWL
jgi:hypothetical protein